MARQIQPGREVTSITEACPKSPKPAIDNPHQPRIPRSIRFNRTHLIGLGLASLIVFSVFSVGQWYMFMVPIQENTVISSTFFGTPGRDLINSLSQLEDGTIIAVGHTRGDFWLVRFNRYLYMLSSLTYGTNRSEYYPALAVCSDGGFALAGITEEGNWPAGEPYMDTDVFLVRTDRDGNHLWNQTLGGPAPDEAYRITQCDDDGFAIGGFTENYGEGLWLLKTDSMGIPEWNYTYGGAGYLRDLIEMNSGFLLVGSRGLVCTDTDGTLLWNRTFGELYWPIRCLATRSGDYLILGRRGDDSDTRISLSYITANGDVLWEKLAGVAGAAGHGIIECHDGGFGIVGTYASPTQIFVYPYDLPTYDSDLYLIRTDTQGNTLWGREYGGEFTAEGGTAILQLADGSFLLAGAIHTPTGDLDIWFLRVTDIPILHCAIAQAVLDSVIISLSTITILAVILAYRFIKRRRQSTPT